MFVIKKRVSDYTVIKGMELYEICPYNRIFMEYDLTDTHKKILKVNIEKLDGNIETVMNVECFRAEDFSDADMLKITEIMDKAKVAIENKKILEI